MAAASSVNQTKPEESQLESSSARQTRTVQEDPRYIRRIESSPAFIGLELTWQTLDSFKQTSQKSGQAIHCKDIVWKMETNIPRNETFRGLVPNSYIHISVSDLYIPRMGLSISLF